MKEKIQILRIKLVTMKTPAVEDDSDYDWHVEGNRWIDKTGKVKWPENDGFDGDIENQKTIKPKAICFRFHL